jgi:hypothetical protein
MPHEPVPTDQEQYDELSIYTLSHSNASFIHQHIVDAYAAQHAPVSQDDLSKPISVVFGLIGLYLHVEKGFTGRQVQKMHMQLAKRRRQWPRLTSPEIRAAFTVSDVLKATPGEERDNAIHQWGMAVWESWQPQQQWIRQLAREELDIR